VAAVGKDWRTAPVRPQVRAALGFIEKLVSGTVTTDDVKACYAAGVTREALVRAAQVCVAFSIIVRLADTFQFDIPPDFMPGAKSLWKRGYMM
jgi:alkylhydroperoxidase family enzyme